METNTVNYNVNKLFRDGLSYAGITVVRFDDDYGIEYPGNHLGYGLCTNYEYCPEIYKKFKNAEEIGRIAYERLNRVIVEGIADKYDIAELKDAKKTA